MLADPRALSRHGTMESSTSVLYWASDIKEGEDEEVDAVPASSSMSITGSTIHIDEVEFVILLLGIIIWEKTVDKSLFSVVCGINGG